MQRLNSHIHYARVAVKNSKGTDLGYLRTAQHHAEEAAALMHRGHSPSTAACTPEAAVKQALASLDKEIASNVDGKAIRALFQVVDPLMPFVAAGSPLHAAYEATLARYHASGLLAY